VSCINVRTIFFVCVYRLRAGRGGGIALTRRCAEVPLEAFESGEAARGISRPQVAILILAHTPKRIHTHKSNSHMALAWEGVRDWQRQPVRQTDSGEQNALVCACVFFFWVPCHIAGLLDWFEVD